MRYVFQASQGRFGEWESEQATFTLKMTQEGTFESKKHQINEYLHN